MLIFHSQGAKRWRIYAPPARRGAAGHPLYRGKNEDRLLDEELGSLLLDVILTPGQVLFVPMGFPHATGTAGTAGKGGTSHEEVSVHLTLGLSTADYEFCLGGLRKAWVQDKSWTAKAEDALPDPLWWRLLAPMPVGFLAQGNGVKTSMALIQNIAQQLLEVLRATGELRQGTRVEEMEELVMKHLSRQVHLVSKFHMVGRPKNQRLFFVFTPIWDYLGKISNLTNIFRWVGLKPPNQRIIIRFQVLKTVIGFFFPFSGGGISIPRGGLS